MNNLQPIFIREQIIKSIREFFEKKGFHEVVVPVLNRSVPLEPNIYPFATRWSKMKAQDNLYLSTSPEASLKKMIAKGIGNCFAIGKSFRNLEGQGSHHNPEFLMLEWYRENAEYTDIMKEVKELVVYCHRVILASEITSASRIKSRSWTSQDDKLSYQGCKINLSGKWKVYSLIDLFRKYAKLDLENLCHAELISASNNIPKRVRDDIVKKGYKMTNQTTWEQLFNQIFLNEIEPKLPKDPFFLTDFPSRISPLCKPKKDDPKISERFELYIGGMELGNGNTENTDYKSVYKVFKVESKKRIREKQSKIPVDQDFIHALEFMQNKSYAGIGLGIDRLAMIMADADDIQTVEPFCF